MPLGTLGNGLGPYWAYIAPVEKTSYADNPSFERGTAGAAQVLSATLGSASNLQTYGAWSLWFTPSSNGTAGAYIGTVQTQSGTAYTASAHVYGSAGVDYMLAVADTSNVLAGSVAFTGGGTWQRYSVSYTENSNTTRRVLVRKANNGNAASTGTVYVDGWQFEAGSLTTYIDGDQDGCQWSGAAHVSQSSRSGQSRAGGSVIALADIGMYVDDANGIGMPPLENSYQSYAIVDGAQYQRTRAGVRTFTLSASPLSGTSHQDYHATRRGIINALKIDAVDEQQPTRFWYIGAGGTVQIDAVLDAGLEGGQMDGPSAEAVGVRFMAFDPYWETTTQQGTALAASTNIGSVNFAAYRDPLGRWGTMPGLDADVYSFINYNGTMFAGGAFTTAGGTTAKYVAQWTRSGWGTFTGGTIIASGQGVRALVTNPGGTLFVGGAFDAGVQGTPGARFIAQYVNNAWGSVGPGTPNTSVSALAIDTFGTVFAGGAFDFMAGTQSPFVAQWTSGGWGTLRGGTINNNVTALQTSPWGSLYVGGLFTRIAGTVGTSIAQYNGAWGTLGALLKGTNSTTAVYTLALTPDYRLIAAGIFGSIGSGSVNNIASWNNSAWQSLGQGLGSSVFDQMLTILPDTNGGLLVGGVISNVNSIAWPINAAYYTGYAWTPLDISIIGVSAINRTFARDNAGTLYMGGGFSGTALAASVAQIVNSGLAGAYPTVKFRNVGASGTARVWELNNTTTGDSIYFNLSLLAGEEATLTLAPGDRSFTSTFRGNLFGYILPGSNLASWHLLPGTNYIAHYCDSGSVQTSIYWSPRHWSADAGTTF